MTQSPEASPTPTTQSGAPDAPAVDAPPPDVPALGAVAAWVIRGATLIGLAISSYLLAVSLTGGNVAGCGEGEGCGKVLSSVWSSWLGVPVSAFAVTTYLLVLALSTCVVAGRAEQTRSHAWSALIVLAVAMCGGAAWFVAIQFRIDSFCPWCMTAHACSAIAGMTILAVAPVRTATPDQPRPRGSVSPGRFTVAAVVGLIGLVALAGVQVAFPDESVGMNTTEGQDGANFDTGPGPDRQVSVLGKAVVRPHEFPMLGSPDAKQIAVYIYDYTCEICRLQHANLEQAIERYGDQLGIVMIPAPLDGECNPVVLETDGAHSEGCELAALAYAVWKAAPDKFVAFDHWLGDPERKPVYADALLYAQEMVGKEKLDAALADPWPKQQLGYNMQLYQMSFGNPPDSRLPKIVYQSNIVSGLPASERVLFGYFETTYGLTPPPGDPATVDTEVDTPSATEPAADEQPPSEASSLSPTTPSAD